jgi:hypothetical protein
MESDLSMRDLITRILGEKVSLVSVPPKPVESVSY